MSQHLQDGFNGTNIRAGLIGELGCSWHLKETEKKSLLAALEIQYENGVTVSIHPGRHKDSPKEIIRFLEKNKVYMRLDLIYKLFKKGFDNQITISHDICTRTRLKCYGGHGYSHINKHVVPLMLERGWSERNIEQLLVTNPANMLCYLN